MKKIKRIICIIMAAVTIVSAPITSYMEARAVEVIALPFLEDLLLSLGISFGLGDQLDFWKDARKTSLDDYFAAAAEGKTVTLPEYGEVDFSDSVSINGLFNWYLESFPNYMALLTGDPTFILKMDQISYHNTGTSATNAMDESVSTLYEDYGGSTEALAEDIQSCFNVIKAGGEFNDNNASDEEKAANRRQFWKTFSALTALWMAGTGYNALPLTALKEYGNSDFTDYDAVFGGTYFDGNYTIDSDGNYEISFSCANSDDTSYPAFETRKCETSNSFPVVGVIEQSLNYVYFYRLGEGSLVRVSLPYLSYKEGRDPLSSSSFSVPYYDFACSFPLYSSQEAALNALKSGDFSDAENLSSSYADFRSSTKGAGSVVGKPFSDYIASLKNLSDLIDIIPGITEASSTYGGTAKALEEVADILNEAAGIPGTITGDDEPGSSSENYSGILGKILAAINSLSSSITNFLGKFMTADALAKLINGLPALLSPAFVAAVDPVVLAVNAMSATLAKQLIDIFPNSAEVAEAILGFPAAVAAAVAKVKFPPITVPDIVIPDIVIPDIVIPDIKIPEIVIPKIENPAVSVYPNITLDPTYDITVQVQDDYLVLGNVISDSVQGVLTDVFVPDQTLALEKIGEMQEYFKFTDDIEDIVAEFEKKVFGIKPSPILKIPIGKSTSKKYKYGTGSYIIIDVSWYATYKEFGDKIILAFAWAFFIWRIFVLMPGIVSGGVGGFFETRDLWNEYSINRAYKNLDSLRRDYTSKD